MSREKQMSLVDHLAAAFDEAICESEETLEQAVRETGTDPDRVAARSLALIQEFIVPDESPDPPDF